MQNPLSMLKNLDLSGLSKVLESLHTHLEKILEQNVKQTGQNEEIIRLLEAINNDNKNKG